MHDAQFVLHHMLPVMSISSDNDRQNIQSGTAAHYRNTSNYIEEPTTGL